MYSHINRGIYPFAVEKDPTRELFFRIDMMTLLDSLLQRNDTQTPRLFPKPVVILPIERIIAQFFLLIPC